MTPPIAVEGVSVEAAIEGSSFWLKTHTSFATGELTVDGSFKAQLGNTILEDVEYISSKQLTAHVPDTLEVGVYDLTVVDPAGRIGVLRKAFAVLPDSTLQDGAPPGDSDIHGDSSAGDGDSLTGDTSTVCSGTCVCDNNTTCSLACPGGGCDLECANQTTCEGACTQDCNTECLGGTTCNLSCGTGCTYSCGGDSVCTFYCGSDCSVSSCFGSAQCTLSCVEPSACAIFCVGEEPVDCGGGVFTCRAPCP